MGRNWILFSRSEQGRKRYASGRVSVEPSEARVSPAPSKMASRKDEARRVLDELSILKARTGWENRPLSALIHDLNRHICNKGYSTLQTQIILDRSKHGLRPESPD